ncbi:MAG: helix-turn-helix domain-containing GNAT family N-acetyltransferase [Pseudomonadota bacterium]
MPHETLAEHVDAVRAFNRFYTRRIGVLSRGMLHSPYSLTEARLIYELAKRRETTASDLGRDLDLDAGYLSRVLQRLAKAGLLSKRRSNQDGRQTILRLTAKGQAAFDMLNERSHRKFSDELEKLSPRQQRRLIASLNTVEGLLGEDPEAVPPYILRPHQPGDIGWVVQRHGAFYAEEFGWDDSFEALVATIAADFLKNFDPKRERCWIAERDGVNVGSVFLVRKTDHVAKLRLLFVEPSARGLGIGARLVRECEAFARRVGYRKITLWTNGNLHAARRIYERAGYALVDEQPHQSFGHDLVGQDWELDLGQNGRR